MHTVELAKMIDHALLKPDMTEEELTAGLEIAKRYHTKSVCVRGYDVKNTSDFLKESDVLIGTVVSFPHGNMTTKCKLFESSEAIRNGADEIDVVLPIGKILSGNLPYVKEEITLLTKLCHEHNVVIKTILETSYMDEKIIAALCELVSEIGVDYVKSSTGFSSEGAKAEIISLMRKYTSPSVGVKASGGIRTLADALCMISAGASRLGLSATQTILDEMSVQENNWIKRKNR